MSVERDLGSLIMKLNPYTKGKKMHFDPNDAEQRRSCCRDG